jgi:hypothetical protein
VLRLALDVQTYSGVEIDFGCPTNLIQNGHRNFFLSLVKQGVGGGGGRLWSYAKLTIHLHLVLRLKKVWGYISRLLHAYTTCCLIKNIVQTFNNVIQEIYAYLNARKIY